MKQVLAIMLMLVASLQAGCMRKVRLADPLPKPIITDTYVVKPIEPNYFMVWAASQRDMEAARKAIGCGICVWAPAGLVETVTHIIPKH